MVEFKNIARLLDIKVAQTVCELYVFEKDGELFQGFPAHPLPLSRYSTFDGFQLVADKVQVSGNTVYIEQGPDSREWRVQIGTSTVYDILLPRAVCQAAINNVEHRKEPPCSTAPTPAAC